MSVNVSLLHRISTGNGVQWGYQDAAKIIRSRSISTSVPFPYARTRTEFSSMSFSVNPFRFFTAFNSWGRLQSQCWDVRDFSRLTVLVMPSLNRMNSTLPSVSSQSGNKVKTSRRAEACESALLCERGNLRYPALPLVSTLRADISSNGRSRWSRWK